MKIHRFTRQKNLEHRNNRAEIRAVSRPIPATFSRLRARDSLGDRSVLAIFSAKASYASQKQSDKIINATADHRRIRFSIIAAF